MAIIFTSNEKHLSFLVTNCTAAVWRKRTFQYAYKNQCTAANQPASHLPLLIPRSTRSGSEVPRHEALPPHSRPQLGEKPHWLQAPAWPPLRAQWKHSLFCSNSNTHCCFQKTHIIILFLKKELWKAESETLRAASETQVLLTLIYHHVSSPISCLCPASSNVPPLPLH